MANPIYISVVVKGGPDCARTKMHVRGITYAAVSKHPDFNESYADVHNTPENRKRVREWFNEPEKRSPKGGMVPGSVLLYSTPGENGDGQA
jgi:hypothetical protein